MTMSVDVENPRPGGEWVVIARRVWIRKGMPDFEEAEFPADDYWFISEAVTRALDWMVDVFAPETLAHPDGIRIEWRKDNRRDS